MKTAASFNLANATLKLAQNPFKQVMAIAVFLFTVTLLAMATGMVSVESTATLADASQARLDLYAHWFESFLTNSTVVHSLITGGAFAVLAFLQTLYKAWASVPKEESFAERTGEMPDFGDAEF